MNRANCHLGCPCDLREKPRHCLRERFFADATSSIQRSLCSCAEVIREPDPVGGNASDALGRENAVFGHSPHRVAWGRRHSEPVLVGRPECDGARCLAGAHVDLREDAESGFARCRSTGRSVASHSCPSYTATVANPNAFAMLLPRSAGLSATSTPQPRSASILACAVSLAPPMIAPA